MFVRQPQSTRGIQGEDGKMLPSVPTCPAVDIVTVWPFGEKVSNVTRQGVLYPEKSATKWHYIMKIEGGS